MQNLRPGLFVSILLGCAMLSVVGPECLVAIGPNQPSRLPALHVKDDGGNVVGAVVGFESHRPLVLLENDGTWVLLRADRESLATTYRVFYTNADCTGTAYLPTFDESALIDAAGDFDEMQQVVYAVGKPSSASNDLGVLLKGTPEDTATPTTNSEWISLNDAGSRCFTATRMGVERFEAVTVQDLEDVFDAPLTVE